MASVLESSNSQLHSGSDSIADEHPKRALKYEYDIRAIESKLAENLSNFRAIESLLQEAFVALQRTSQRTDRALTTYIPHIDSALEESLGALHELAEALPSIQNQVRDIRGAYDSGRDKAHALVHSLQYLNTPLPLRLLQIIFASSAPVATRTKVLVRLWFAVMIVLCAVLMLVGVRSAVRVYRVRLVWGERLID